MANYGLIIFHVEAEIVVKILSEDKNWLWALMQYLCLFDDLAINMINCLKTCLNAHLLYILY